MAGVRPLDPREASLWLTSSSAAYVTGLAAALLALCGGYLGSSQEASLGDQYPWVALGIGGVVLSGVAHARWLLAGFAAVRLRERQLLTRMEQLAPENAVPKGQRSQRTHLAVSGSAMTRYHEASCLAVMGREVQERAIVDFAAEGRSPCGLCQPAPPLIEGRT